MHTPEMATTHCKLLIKEGIITTAEQIDALFDQYREANAQDLISEAFHKLFMARLKKVRPSSGGRSFEIPIRTTPLNMSPLDPRLKGE